MRNKYVQMSLLDIYHNVGKGLKNDKPELFKLLDEHINWDELVSDTFCHTFYQRFGRNRKCDLDSFIKSMLRTFDRSPPCGSAMKWLITAVSLRFLTPLSLHVSNMISTITSEWSLNGSWI